MSAQRTCPLCGYTRGRPLWHEIGYRYLRCTRCAMVYADVTRETYLAARHNAWDESRLDQATLAFYETAREAVHERFLDLMGPPAGRRLLDVGCGIGAFLARAQRRGWDVYGCDTSEHWAGLAQQRVGAERVSHGEAASIIGDRTFDLVTMWDVIEHVYDPLPLLRELRAALAPGGRLFIRTPNIAYVLPVYGVRRRLGQPVELGPLNHVVYFGARTMDRALRDAGFVPGAPVVLVPPQVPVVEDPELGAVSVRIKNAWAGLADTAARLTRGRVLVGSDLDVIAAPA